MTLLQNVAGRLTPASPRLCRLHQRVDGRAEPAGLEPDLPVPALHRDLDLPLRPHDSEVRRLLLL